MINQTKTDFDGVDIINNYEDEIDVSENKLATKTTQIQQLISHFEYRLLGFMWKSNAEKYFYTGRPLMGDDAIQKTMLLLHPFSREVLLISDKKDYQWQKQLLRTRLELAALLTKSTDVDIKDSKEIWRSFTNLMVNIGDIIVNKNAQDYLKAHFGLDRENNADAFDTKPKSNADGGKL